MVINRSYVVFVWSKSLFVLNIHVVILVLLELKLLCNKLPWHFVYVMI